MLRWAPSGLKSSSGPATPVVPTASSSAPRRNRSRRSERSLIASVVIRAAHVIPALFAEQFALALGEPAAAHRAEQHRFGVLRRNCYGTGVRDRFRGHSGTIIMRPSTQMIRKSLAFLVLT